MAGYWVEDHEDDDSEEVVGEVNEGSKELAACGFSTGTYNFWPPCSVVVLVTSTSGGDEGDVTDMIGDKRGERWW